MANIFKLAKAYQRKHPRTDWQDCIQAVKGKKRKPAAKKKVKKKSYRQTGGSNKKYDRDRTAKAPGERKSRSGKTYYERRKNRSDVPGSLTGVSLSSLKRLALKKLNLQEDSLVLRKYRAGKKTVKKKLQKKISDVKRQINQWKK